MEVNIPTAVLATAAAGEVPLYFFTDHAEAVLV